MSASYADALAGRPVLVTGHTGFKGSWLAVWLHRLGARVTGYALPPAAPHSHFAACGVRALLVGHHEGDVRDGPTLERVVREARPEVIFHLAAQALVRDSYRAPRETFEVNVIGVASLLEAVRAAGGPCVVVVVTSDKCYENTGQVWGYREGDALGGHDPYSASKGAAEIVAAAYRRSFFPPQDLARHGVGVATARAGNVIGGGDWSRDRIVSDVVRCLLAGEPVPVRSPRAVRPWQHVLEPLSGYLTLAARMLAEPSPAWCDGWNFGPHGADAVTVRELVEAFLAEWGGGTWQDVSDPQQPHEAHTLRLSIDKALAALGWRPRWGVAEAVRRTAAWYRLYHRGSRLDMLGTCHSDIEAYEGQRT
jgi:CDP-glucose 4,6-dehydratase